MPCKKLVSNTYTQTEIAMRQLQFYYRNLICKICFLYQKGNDFLCIPVLPNFFYSKFVVTNLTFSAWGKGRLCNEFYIPIRIHHSSTQFPSQTSHELSLFTIRNLSYTR